MNKQLYNRSNRAAALSLTSLFYPLLIQIGVIYHILSIEHMFIFTLMFMELTLFENSKTNWNQLFEEAKKTPKAETSKVRGKPDTVKASTFNVSHIYQTKMPASQKAGLSSTAQCGIHH